MAGLSQELKVEINLENVLWRTRGRQWDYTFVLHPLYPVADSWYDIHAKIFAGITPTPVPVSRGGVLVDGTEEHPFVATALLDPVYKDAAGRPIAHYLIWFLPFDQPWGSTLKLPSNWGHQLMVVFGDARDSTFDAAPAMTMEGADEMVEDVFARARDLAQPIDLDGIDAPVSIELRVEAEKKKSLAPSLAFRKWALFLGLVAAILLGLALWYVNR